MTSSTWATSQLSQLLQLDDASLQQILDYTSTLPKDTAAEHLKNLLGDSPKALEFISTYNARRDAPTTATSASEPSKYTRKPHRKKPPLNKLPPPRQVEDYGSTAGAYRKEEEMDYMTGKRRSQVEPTLAMTLALSDQPDARQLPKSLPIASSKPPPSAAGPLISDLPNVRSGSRASSRTSSPAPKTKINVQGGASMHGASTTLQDLVWLPSIQRRTSIDTTLTGFRNPHTRNPNQSFSLHCSIRLPPLQLPCNAPSPPRRRAQLLILRQNHLRERRPWSLYFLLHTTSFLRANLIDD